MFPCLSSTSNDVAMLPTFSTLSSQRHHQVFTYPSDSDLPLVSVPVAP